MIGAHHCSFAFLNETVHFLIKDETVDLFHGERGFGGWKEAVETLSCWLLYFIKFHLSVLHSS